MDTSTEGIECDLTCKHSPCLCLVKCHEEFCSEECRIAGEAPECRCTHEACSLE